MSGPSPSHPTRPAAVAGRFYPGEARVLRDTVRALLAQARGATGAGPSPKAIIAPHAGYLYSGPIAASAYARLAAARGRVKRVLLFGPSHFVEVDGLAVPSVEAFATPLGMVPLDRDALRTARELSQVVLLDDAHAREHSIEVQLPFLQLALGDFSLLPFAVGDARSDDVSAVMERLWGGDETCIVVSSDLSHYYDGATASRHDRATADAIALLEPSKIGGNDACGAISIRALLQCARKHGLRAEVLDVRNSGDTAGPRDRVVGYGAFAFVAAA
jgi:AmmeMemoRadiSam system protein B